MHTGNARRCLCCKGRPGNSGISVAELLVAVSILGIVAVVAIPHLTSTNTHTLELATQRVVDAIRFARSEAVRTGKPYGVSASTSTQQVKVYWWDDSGGTPTAVYNVYHPLSKNLYTVDFGDSSPFAAAAIDAVSFKFANVASATSDLIFAGDSGAPRYQPSVEMLETGTITLALGNEKTIIDVAPFTGRVTMQ